MGSSPGNEHLSLCLYHDMLHAAPLLDICEFR